MVIGGIAFLAGLFIGLVVLGWWLWPVQWSDAAPKHLRADLQEDYLHMAIDSYARTPDDDMLARVVDGLGKENAITLLAKVEKDYQGKLDEKGIAAYQKALGIGASSPTPSPTAAPGKAGPMNLTIVLGLMCLLTLVIGVILVYLFFFRGRQGTAKTSPADNNARTTVAPVYSEAGVEQPVVQYLTTYTLGNDLYDDSFSIDSPTGEFLGECGVGISETIGVGDPKKVTAFEVWLFDKNDIQTVTKVLMSNHAFNDPVISQRLASKGEPVLAEGGKRITLETQTLVLEARVVSMSYGQGALPQNSFFEQSTLELAVWPKKTA
jgi:hypothetical protein